MSDLPIVAGFRNKQDKKSKEDAYLKRLKMQSEISKKEAIDFKDKLKREGTAYIPTLSEVPKFRTTAEEVLDVTEQRNQAIKNASVLLPRPDEARDFVSRLDTAIIVDPLEPTNRTTEVSLFNQYFDRFRKTLEGIKTFSSPRTLLRLWKNFGDNLVEDILPKNITLLEITNLLDTIKANLDPADPDYVNQVKDIDDAKVYLASNKLSEKRYTSILNSLSSDQSIATVRRVFKSGGPAVPVGVGGVGAISSKVLPGSKITLLSSFGAKAGKKDTDNFDKGIADGTLKVMDDIDFKHFMDVSPTGTFKVKDQIAVLKKFFPSADRARVTTAIAGAGEVFDALEFYHTVDPILFTKFVVGADDRLKRLVAFQKSRKGKGIGIRTGRGIEATPVQSSTLSKTVDQERPMRNLIPFGNIRLHKYKINEGILSIYQSGSFTRPNIKALQSNIHMSEDMTKFILNFIKTNNTVDVGLFYKLDERERKLVITIFKLAKLHQYLYDAGIEVEKNSKTDEDKKLIDQFELVKGQILAGQNNRDVILELVRIANELYKRDYITLAKLNKILLGVYDVL